MSESNRSPNQAENTDQAMAAAIALRLGSQAGTSPFNARIFINVARVFYGRWFAMALGFIALGVATLFSKPLSDIMSRNAAVILIISGAALFMEFFVGCLIDARNIVRRHV